MKFRILFSLYTTTVYYVLFVLKISNRDKITDILFAAGYGSEMKQGPLESVRLLIYLMGIGLFVLMLFLPKIMRFTKQNGTLDRCLLVTLIFWAFSLLAWLATKTDFPFLGFYIVFGGLLGIVEGVQGSSLPASYLDDRRLSTEAKCELLKFEDVKWWRGLTLLWSVIVAAGIAGFLSWVFGSYPSTEDVGRIPDLGKVPELTFIQGMIIIFSVVPGIGILVWNIIRRTNYIHKQLGNLYIENGDQENKHLQ